MCQSKLITTYFWELVDQSKIIRRNGQSTIAKAEFRVQLLQSWCNWTDCTSKYYKEIIQGRCLKTFFVYLTKQNAEIVCFKRFFSMPKQLWHFCLPKPFLWFSFTCLSQSSGYITSGYETPNANDPNTNAMNPQMATIVAFQWCPMTFKPMYTTYKQNRRTRPHNKKLRLISRPLRTLHETKRISACGILAGT